MKTNKITLLGLFLLAILPAISGTTYYVRSSGGADSNDGLTANSAFLTLSKVFSGTPALADGDIINISGTFDYYVSYKIVKNITIQGTDKSSSIIRGSAGAVKNCFIVGSSSPVSTPTVVIENVTFQDFDYWSDGASNNGGVINVIGASSLTCRKVVFKNNQAYGGGAVNINAGTGVFEDCYFLNNKAKQRTGAANSHGGAIAVSTSGTGNISVTIDRCLFEGNTAENSGPAMRFVTAGTGNATLLVQNSTFTGNIVKLPSTTTTSGVLTLSIAATGTSDVKLVNNTIAYNTSEIATSTANGIYIGGVTDKVVAINNIIYSNTRPDNSDYSITTALNIKLKESRNNITSQAFDFAANTATGAASDNVSSVSANNLGLAATLAENGGETKTLAISSSSLAKNTGYATGVPTIDQRGITRHTVDKGAYEYVTYRSKASGNWGSAGSWQSSGDNSTWADATVVPTVNVAGALSVQNGHLITVASNATSPSLTVNAGGQLTLNSDATLGITGNLSINSNGDNGTGTLVDKSTNGGLTVSNGTTNVQQFITSSQTGVNGRNWYISSPLTAALSSTITTATGNGLVYYNGTTNWPAAPTEMVVMKGYIAKSPAQNTTINFSGGTLNTGAQSVTNLPLGFNLVGNPYASYVDFAQATRTGVANSIWYRSKKGVVIGTESYNFHTYNVSGGISVHDGTAIIPPMQSFWIKTTSATNTFGFSNTMRLHQDQSVVANRLKAPKANTQPLIRLQVSNGVNNDETVVYFNPNALGTFDEFDSQKMFNNSADMPEIFTTAGSEKLVINGMDSIPLDTEIPLGFVTAQSGDFSIECTEFKNFDQTTRIILKDKLNPSNEIELGSAVSYNFSSQPTTVSTNRFSLLIKAPGVTTGAIITERDQVSVFVNKQNEIEILAKENSKYIIYNATGQLITTGKTGNQPVTLLAPNKGVYFVTVNGQSKRIIIK